MKVISDVARAVAPCRRKNKKFTEQKCWRMDAKGSARRRIVENERTRSRLRIVVGRLGENQRNEFFRCSRPMSVSAISASDRSISNPAAADLCGWVSGRLSAAL